MNRFKHAWLRAGAAIAILMSAYPASVADTTPSPYTGQETRNIKALSDRETADLLAGRGMGYALAAELNRYPGPLHVIELADKLALSSEQRYRTQDVFDAMQSRAKALGAQIVAAEQAFDRAFASDDIDQQRVAQQTVAIGTLYGQYRAAHLAAHLEMKTLLRSEQISAYDQLRGYSAASPSAPHNHGHH